MIKVLSVFGTRPEAIKMAPVILELSKYPDKIKSVVCVTAQHREMLDQVLSVFKIAPDYDLDIMESEQTLSDITSRVLLGLEKVIKRERPDILLVHGDTTTTFAGTLAAFYCGVKVGHVEAGLRTYDKYSPFPEEINREFVSLVADFNFAPTATAANALIREGKDPKTIFITGNTAIDALKVTTSKNYKNELLDWIGKDKMILLTAHRRENLGEPLKSIFSAINEITFLRTNVKIIYPIHLNPQIRKIANDLLRDNKKIKLIEPLSVVDFHNFMKRADIILTDSGGIQEEAPALGKPVLVLRNTTERPEGIKAGTLKLIGTDKQNIVAETLKLLDDVNEYKKMSTAKNPYGDGSSAKQIVEILLKSL